MSELFAIWSPGDGHETKDCLLGRVEAETFGDACRLLAERDARFAEYFRFGADGTPLFWGQKLVSSWPGNNPDFGVAERERIIERVLAVTCLAPFSRTQAEALADNVVRPLLRENLEKELDEIARLSSRWVLDGEPQPWPSTIGEFRLYPHAVRVGQRAKAHAFDVLKKL